jgi:hypothetical protein
MPATAAQDDCLIMGSKRVVSPEGTPGKRLVPPPFRPAWYNTGVCALYVNQSAG